MGILSRSQTEIIPFDFSRDFAAVEKLVLQEEWPFLRSDFELSHAQPGGCSNVAYQDGKLAGFFTTHSFGKIGYLDMMIVAPEFRRLGVARPLYMKTMKHLAKNGMISYVVHTTNDSARIMSIVGFKKTNTSFTLLRREPHDQEIQNLCPVSQTNVYQLDADSAQELIELDERIFGITRQHWIRTILSQPETLVYGFRRENGRLSAALWLRPRRENAMCLDGCIYSSLEELGSLIRHVTTLHFNKRLECFASTYSYVHGLLEGLGFEQPNFFRAIGPLVEWHKGKVGNVGTAVNVQCLMWL